jgi:hypothetical protein
VIYPDNDCANAAGVSFRLNRRGTGHSPPSLRYILVIVKFPDPLQPDVTPLIVQVPETVFMLLIDP